MLVNIEALSIGLCIQPIKDVVLNQGHLSKNHLWIIPTRMTVIKKRQIISFNEDVENLEPSYTAGRSVK